MKHSFILVFSAFFIGALAGCQAGRTVLGTWEFEGLPMTGSKIPLVTFKPDGTNEMNIDYKVGGMSGKMRVTGTFKVNGDKITQTVSGVDIPGGDVIQNSLLGSVKGQIQETIGKSGTGTIQWHSNDEFVIAAEDGGTYTLRRTKQ